LVQCVCVVEKSIKRLDARNRNTHVLSKFDGSAEERLDFQRSAGGEVLVHGAGCGSGLDHGFHGLLVNVLWEDTALSLCKNEELIDDAGDHRTSTRLLE
jgi:hypothetical protein